MSGCTHPARSVCARRQWHGGAGRWHGCSGEGTLAWWLSLMEGGGEPHRRGVRGGLDGGSAQRLQWKLSVSYSYEL
jgi:hypothetical protein